MFSELAPNTYSPTRSRYPASPTSLARKHRSPTQRHRRIIQEAKLIENMARSVFPSEYLNPYNDEAYQSRYVQLPKEDEAKIRGEVDRALRAQMRARARLSVLTLHSGYEASTTIVEPQEKSSLAFPLVRSPTELNQISPPFDHTHSPKRLAPLSRFNPFVRTRSESLSSIIEPERIQHDSSLAPQTPTTSWARKLRRVATMAELFSKVH